MARTYAGQDTEDIQSAYAALLKIGQFEELAQFILDTPIVRTAAFAAMLRQVYLKSQGDDSRAAKAFAGLYRTFFTLLHNVAYRDCCEKAFERAVEPVSRKPVTIPQFYRGLLTLLAGRPAPPLDPPADPSTDGVRIKTALETLVAQSVELPLYEPTAGVKWNLITLQCPRCRSHYSTVRAHAMDLVVAPQFRDPLREGRINVPGCPVCGEICARPLGSFIAEQPLPDDPVGSLACVVRARNDYFIYLPPPGTTRSPELDRVLEVRLSFAIDDLKWPLPQVASMRISYRPEELQNLGADEANEKIPRAMAAHVADIAGKIRSGMLPLYDAEQQIFETVPHFGADWPLIAAPIAGADGGDTIEGLVQAMIAEAVAQAKGARGTVRALLALGTAVKYFECNERAAAERGFARALDILARTPRTEPSWDSVARAIRVHRADLLASLGRHEEAEKIRAEADQEETGDAYRDRVMRAQRNCEVVLSLSETGRIGEALDRLPPCIAELESLLAEKDAQDTPEHRDWGAYVLQALSGAVANYAAMLADIADCIEVVTLVNCETLPQEMSRVPSIDPPAAVSLIDELRPRLRKLFPAGFNAKAVRLEAIGLLQEALEISTSMRSWNFAAIQANRLMMLFDRLRARDKANEYAGLSIEHANRARDRIRESSGHAFLARDALEQGQGATALACLKSSALMSIREEIARGHRANERPSTTYLGEAVMHAVELGADRVEAVALLENLKAATMAPSLLLGFPIGRDDGGGSELSAAVAQVHRERERARLKAMWRPDDATLRDEIKALDDRLSQLREQLSLRDRRFAAWADASTTDLASGRALSRDLAAVGGDCTRLLGMFVLGRKIWSYLIAGGNAWTHEAVFEHRTLGDAWGRDGLASAAEILLAPFLDELRRMQPAERLLISPDAGLFDIPFAALPVGSDPLCTRATLSVVQGAGALEALKNRGRTTFANFVGIGGPQRMDQQDLPGARSEVQAICSIFGSAVPPLIGRNALVRALIEAARTADVLHIACHAEPDDATHRYSRLLLTPDVRGNDSGILSEDRVLFELEVPRGCLVNLAGCTTAVQAQVKGPLLGGLVPAFQVTGAGSVLASVRPIADGEATSFQKAFYARLIRGAGPARALAETQRDCILGRLGAAMTDVQAWAPYVLYGAS